MASAIIPIPGDVLPGCYMVDEAASCAILHGSTRNVIFVRGLRIPARVTGRVTIGTAGKVLEASFLLTPRPRRGLRLGPAWRHIPTSVTAVRIYRITSYQHRAEIELTWALAAAPAVLSLWWRPPRSGDSPDTLRFSAFTMSPPAEPQLWIGLVLLPQEQRTL